ncbi:MAG: DUF4838 domain-containing protein [Armatimonadota bacterium]
MNAFDLVPLILPLLVLASGSAWAAQPTTIAKAGKPMATIVLGDDATAPERFAAAQLADIIEQISGARLTVTDTAPLTGSRIYVGQTASVKRLLKGFDWEQLRRDGILIRTVGSDVVLAGDRPRGSIYAVQELLETKMGVRWFAADATRIPKKNTISLPAMNVCYTPKLMYREAYYRSVQGKDGLFALHMRMNGQHQQITADMGSHYTLLGFVHTSYPLLPTEKYFAAHPEWYALNNGKRVDKDSQLCLTNPEMKRELVKNALAWIQKQPDAGMISISQNDSYNPCQCDSCKRLVKQTGSESGAFISFVNDVAAEIEKQYPDFLVETLAYQYTRQAPTNIKPRDNVIVRLCSIENDFGRPITAAQNADFYKDLVDWRKISKRLYIWNYVVNFSNYLIPHPNITNLGPDLRTFTENNVVGMFEQGDSFNVAASMQPLKTYLMAKLMWNPNQPEMPIIKEFMDGYYGAAGKPMLKALNIFETVVQRSPKIKLSCFMPSPSDIYTMKDMAALKSCYDQAEAAVANDAELLERVQIQRLAFDHLCLLTMRSFARNKQELPGTDWPKLVDHFVDLSNTTGNNWIHEGRLWDEGYRALLRSRTKKLPAIRKATAAMGVSGVEGKDWMDIQDDAVNLSEEGKWVSTVSDEAASDGCALEMPNTHNQWAIQYYGKESDLRWPLADISMEFRVISVEGAALNPQDGVLSFGVYNTITKETVEKIVTVADIKPGYQSVVLKGIAPKVGMYLYAAPVVNPGIKAVRVDRFAAQPSK